MILDKPQSGDPWNALFDVEAVALISDIVLNVVGQVSLGEKHAINLSVRAGARSGTAPEDLLDTFVEAQSGAKLDSQFQLPPTAALPDNDLDPFEAALNLQKDDLGWYLESANARLFWQEMFWYPINGVDISLQDLYFDFIARRQEPVQGMMPSSGSLAFSAAFGGSITLYNIPMAVVVTYQSKTKMTELTCIVDDDARISLQDIATEALLNPKSGMSRKPNPSDLSQEVATTPVPDSVPIDLGWCSSEVWGSQKFCILTFSASELIRLQLKANFQLNWQVTSYLTVTDMGVYFDITNPTSSNNPCAIKGYAYGSVLIANSVKLFGFVAGESQPSGRSQYLLGLSLSYDPDASLGVSAQSVISDKKFIGNDVPTDLWTFPSSWTSSKRVNDTVTSVSAHMTMRLQQTADQLHKDEYTTKIISMQASLAVDGQWSIFDTVTLDSLALNVVVVPGTPETKNEASYYAQLLGVVSDAQSKVGLTHYKVVLTATLLRDVQTQTTAFTAIVSAYYVGQPNADVPISALLQMPFIGINPTVVRNDPSANTIPAELSLEPADLLKSPVAQCSLRIEETGKVWSLKELDAFLYQSKPWTIIPDKLTITNSTLNLKITDPRLPSHKIQFTASTTVKVGKLMDLNASISISRGANEDTVTVVLQAAKFQDICNELVGTGLTIPEGCPINDQILATVTVICTKKSGEGRFVLASVCVSVSAHSLTTWQLGPISVTDLSLSATFDRIAGKNTLSLSGRTKISGVENPVDVQITLKDMKTLILSIQTKIQPTQLVGTFVPGGLDAQTLQAPNITSATGLDGYRSAPGINASITFIRGPPWYADNLSLDVVSGTQKWFLVKDYLWASDLKLTLALKNMHTQSQLSVILGINFWFKLRPPETKNDKVSCSLEATSKQLSGLVDTSACNLAQFLYIGTAGYWDPPDLLAIKLIKSLTITMNWDDGTGKFTATCFDWNLSKTLPKLAAMLNPRLIVNLTKGGRGFDAARQLAGTAMLVTINECVEHY